MYSLWQLQSLPAKPRLPVNSDEKDWFGWSRATFIHALICWTFNVLGRPFE